MSEHHGLVVVDKPAGMTSTDVVRALRRAFGTRRVGHAGTLDPDATGVLLVCVGQGTKLVPYLQTTTKEYRTSARLGTETVSDDAASEPIRTAEWAHVRRADAEGWLAAQRGTIQQVPPRVSALKIDGRRLYDRVRAGEDVDASLVPRPVEIETARIVDWAPPELELEMTVGKGFYVRSLVRDLGRALGSAAHVRTLRRTRVGSFGEEQAVDIEHAGPETLLDLCSGLRDMPLRVADDEGERQLRCGQRPLADSEHFSMGSADAEAADAAPGDAPGSRPYRVVGPAGLVAICTVDEQGRFVVQRGFPPGLS